jgi:propane monooxygenase reductase subunit
MRTLNTRVEAIEELTHDIRRIVLEVAEGESLTFRPGQYVDISIPGEGGHHRSFSMANTPTDAGRLEFMIKIYPDGHFSGLLADGSISVGDELEINGPYGVFTLRENERRLLYVGGGAGMAPILSHLRALAQQGSEREAVYYYGARTERDLFHLDELKELGESLSAFRFVPALSEQDDWSEGESGLITDVVARCEDDLADVDAYLCGPPPMVDAAIDTLLAKGMDESRIHYDKFTTTEESEETSRT